MSIEKLIIKGIKQYKKYAGKEPAKIRMNQKSLDAFIKERMPKFIYLPEYTHTFNYNGIPIEVMEEAPDNMIYIGENEHKFNINATD